MCEDNKPEKVKFKLDQKVYTIRNGYVESFKIKAIFRDKWNAVCVSEYCSDFHEGKYRFDNSSVVAQDDCYPTKQALIKALEKQEE